MMFFIPFAGLNLRKAYGPDGVPPIVLKNCASELTPCLVKLFRLCLSKSIFPSCWKFAHIQPVPKKGDRSNPSNYRPIALIKGLKSLKNRKSLAHVRFLVKRPTLITTMVSTLRLNLTSHFRFFYFIQNKIDKILVTFGNPMLSNTILYIEIESKF